MESRRRAPTEVGQEHGCRLVRRSDGETAWQRIGGRALRIIVRAERGEGARRMARRVRVKKTGRYKGKSNRPGGGGRFQQMVDAGMSPALAAYIGRKKYGKKRFAKMAAAGRKRAARKK